MATPVADVSKHIAVDPEIMGGTPVIRGTRMTVYSVLGRIEYGETVDDILQDNPDLQREAIDAAVHYARAHPLVVDATGTMMLAPLTRVP